MPTLPFSAAGQIALAAVLAVVAFFLLLPKPRSRSLAGGTAAALAALAVFALWMIQAFTVPTQGVIATGLFVLFSAGALVFGTLLVVQRNPARGAIAFSFVILSTCGLFLLLAAPFLMAATVIIYAGAIIVTFLFVLMLSHVDGPSDENDRSREPLLGSLAGFAFTGLVLFCLYKNAPPAQAEERPGTPPLPLPAAVLTDAERVKLSEAADRLNAEELRAPAVTNGAISENLLERFDAAVAPAESAATTVTARLDPERGLRNDSQGQATRARAVGLMRLIIATRRTTQETVDGMRKFDPAAFEASRRKIHDEVRLLFGAGELPARNIANLGLLLYADHLLAVELAGTLLLVATIGAVAIAGRKGAAA